MSVRNGTAGRPNPLGATVDGSGVNFCLYARHATRIDLELFDNADDANSTTTVLLPAPVHRTDDYWHVFVEGIRPGQLYGYRVWGPDRLDDGMRYDPSKLLIDPYAVVLANTNNYCRSRAQKPGDNTATAYKCVVANPDDYDWQGDTPLARPYFDTVIYELHVAGFTKNPNSGIPSSLRGTYAGLIAKIPYLVDLGIKTVELMPVQQFDAQAAPNGVNYWGYQPVAWFAPHRPYSSRVDVLGPLDEFRDLVRAFHRADIEVILDVVFNHTAEGNEAGPTLSFRGIDNATYYLLDSKDRCRYVDDTGCGNTINSNHPVVRRLILDCLRSWVRNMHIDGFRFDLAACLSRGEDGQPLAIPPVLVDIDTDPLLAGTKIIAEAWDAAGLYQIARFPGNRWSVWNGRFRDTVRQFVKGDNGVAAAMSDCLVASARLFHDTDRLPGRSVNFVTAHDGFTLNDLVTYDQKHNEANDQENRDGTDENFSWNCGAEGPTEDPAIDALRCRQIKNFVTILLMSEGRPMLVMGDEVRRTQRGNNNAYCQDNDISWFDWEDLTRHVEIHRFTQGLIRFHQSSHLFRDREFWGEPGATSITWHGVKLQTPSFEENAHSLAYELQCADDQEHLYVILNSYWLPLSFELPPTRKDQHWCRLIDTALKSPDDLSDGPLPPILSQQSYTCQARSCVVLVSRTTY